MEEMYQLYTQQMNIWFDLLPEEAQEEIILENSEQRLQDQYKSMMEDPDIKWN